MSAADPVLRNLAASLLAGAWTAPAMTLRAVQAWGSPERWLGRLARRLVKAHAADAPRPGLEAVARFICEDRGFRQARCRAWRAQQVPLQRLFWVPDTMAPAPGPPASWDLPALTSPGQLAGWLGLEPTDLDWFADCQGRARGSGPGPQSHYTYRWLVTRRRVRLLEVPKARLKAIQRQLLHELLDRIPPHEAAHGYRRGRSVATYIAPHAGRLVVLHLDLCRFFPSIRAARVRAVYRTAGYPDAVARLLAGLCTSAVPDDVLRARPPRGRAGDEPALRLSHLPQGAPTSPALANLCAYRLDCRLEGLARAAGARYTRYADDLVFSGDERFARGMRRFHLHVCRIALEEGFEVNTRKSHFMRQGVRQQVAGIVLNARPNVPRAAFDRLKAILTNCARHGPTGQNRDGRADFRSHLAGRIAYLAMIHPLRGRRLRDLFERIRWE
jgi:hypothetical protein